MVLSAWSVCDGGRWLIISLIPGQYEPMLVWDGGEHLPVGLTGMVPMVVQPGTMKEAQLLGIKENFVIVF